MTEGPAPALDEAQATRGEPNLIQRWKWFVAPGPAEGVFKTPEQSRRVYGPTVTPIVAPLADDRVGIRLEVHQVWKTRPRGRPAARRSQ